MDMFPVVVKRVVNNIRVNFVAGSVEPEPIAVSLVDSNDTIGYG
jgi:hypothetical protein